MGGDGLLVGALSTLLMAGAGLVVFPRLAVALLAPLFFAMTPMVVIALQSSAPLSRLLPPMAAWLIAMQLAVIRGRPWTFAVAGVCLGAGLYAHTSGIVTMTLLLAVSVIASLQAQRQFLDRRIAILVAGFVVTALPLMIAFMREPAEWGRIATAYGLYDGARFNPLQGLREMLSWVGLVARTEVYYDYFNPSLWFLSGGTLRASLTEPRAALLPLMILIPAGLHRLVTTSPGASATLLIGGILVSPVAAALTTQPPTAARLVIAAPFAALLAVHGSVHLADQRRPFVRGLGVVAAAAVPLCYGWFLLA
jgi:hypothetical protein